MAMGECAAVTPETDEDLLFSLRDGHSESLGRDSQSFRYVKPATYVRI